MSASGQHIKEIVWNTGNKMKNALPVILFFMVLFYTIMLFFGISYIMLVSIMTVIFQRNYQKRQSPGGLIKLMFLHFLLAALAYLATCNFPFCLLLNLMVPFLLIFKQSSQFNQMGYFSELMTFTFLQLMPTDIYGFGRKMAVFAYAFFYFFLVLYIYQRRRRPRPEYQLEQKGLLLVSEWMMQELAGQEERGFVRQLFSLQQELYQEAYHKYWRKGTRQLNERVHYAFALMYQRAAYFVSSRYQSGMLEQESGQDFCRRMAAFLKSAGENGFSQREQRKKLLEEGQRLLGEIEQKDGELYIFCQNFLRPFLSVLKQMEEPAKGSRRRRSTGAVMRSRGRGRLWEPKLPGRFLPVLRSDAFETKFALRMSIVLAITFSYSMLSHAEHGFWLPLNAFLLLRPMYEESVHRVKTRFIGTAAGSILLAMILPLLPGTTGHILFASIIVVGLYTATPGTWQQALCSTCFALSFTTLAIAEKTALELRLLYVVIAILIVLTVNRFFFPTSIKSQFWYNFQTIFHMQHSYLRILENSLNRKIEYDIICDAQLQYHLVHEQIMQYLKKHESEQADYYKELLGISFRMVSEMEQLLILVNTMRRGTGEAEILKDYILYTDYVLNQIQQMLDMKADRDAPQIKEIRYQRKMENEPQLSLLMTRYSKNLSHLYQTVCRHSGNCGTPEKRKQFLS